MTHLLIIFLLFLFLALVTSLVLSLITPEENFRALSKVTLKNLLLIITTVFALGLAASLIAVFF